MNKPAVCAVVVTYNRLAMLRQCVAALRAQSDAPTRILVVNNGSTDGTTAWLAGEAEEGLWVINQANLGGAAGFYTGIKAAFADEHDFFWCMDDDTIPSPLALERLLAAARDLRDEPNAPKLGWLCSLVRWTDGSLHRMNEPKLGPFAEWPGDFPGRQVLPARWCSFVSVLVTREGVAAAGLPLKSMFIWYDDVEFTARLVQAGFAGALVLDSTAKHLTLTNHTAGVEGITPLNVDRFRYAFRNEVVFQRTMYSGRRKAFLAQYLRLMARRCLLLARAGKARYLAIAMAEGIRGLWFDRRPELPLPTGRLSRSPGGHGGGSQPLVTQPSSP